MKRFICLIFVLLCGCHYTPRERKQFGMFVAASLADAYTTDRNISAGAEELNPIMDDRPSRDEIILFKGAAIGLVYLLGEIFPEQREGLLLAATTWGFIGAGWNEYQWQRR
jgi:hypothetical protein